MAKNLLPVFVDTNVFFSGFYKPTGYPREILNLHQQNAISIVTSQSVLDELVRNLKAKFPSILPSVIRFLTLYPTQVQPHPTPKQIKAWSQVINPDDAVILAAAVSAKTKYFVTGNKKHFTPQVARASGLTILSPKEFILLL